MNPANYSSISFPWLGLEVNPGRGFDLGPLTINFYGLVIACGLWFLAGLAPEFSRNRKEQNTGKEAAAK